MSKMATRQLVLAVLDTGNKGICEDGANASGVLRLIPEEHSLAPFPTSTCTR